MTDKLEPHIRSYTEYDNSSVGEEEHFEPRHLWAAFSDWQVGLKRPTQHDS